LSLPLLTSHEIGTGDRLRMRNRLFALLAWLQLFVSLLLATAIVWGFVAYQASFGQFVQSVGASIEAMSKVVDRTAETVEARRDLLDQTATMLVATGNLINELQVAANNQARLAPQYAAGMKSVATEAGTLSTIFQSIGNAMLVSVPTNIQWQGMKPILVMTQPLNKPAQELIANAQHLQVVSQTLSSVADAISHDGQNLSAAVSATSQQALKVIAEAQKTLGRLNTQDLPKALEELRATSKNLSTINAQVDIVGNVGWVLLIVGLLLAVWCFLNSLGALMLANFQCSDSSSKTSSLADS
jgi:hypothetical protein